MPTPTPQIFKRTIKIDGETVMRPDIFYVGLNKEGRAATSRLILDHGGKICNEPRSRGTNVIALVDPYSKAVPHGPSVYSVDYITACIRNGKRLDKEQFRIKPVHMPGPPKFGSAQKQKGLTPANSVHAQEGGHVHQANGATHVDENGKDGAGYSEQRTADENERQGKREQASLRVERSSVLKRKESGKVVREKPIGGATENAAWTAMEDKLLVEIYEDASIACQEKNRATEFLRTLHFWLKMESHNLLPEGRSAKDCFRRAEYLRKKNETERIARNQAEVVTDEEPIVVVEGSNRPVNTPQKRNAGRESPTTNRHKDSSVGSSVISTPVLSAKGRPFKRRPKNKTQLKIFRIVKGLAQRGNVSEKRAFRVLRQERGNWKRALQALRKRLDGNPS